MLVEELDPALVDPLGNSLANLVRTPPLNHIQACPPILRLGSGRSSNEQRVFQLALEAVFLDMVG